MYIFRLQLEEFPHFLPHMANNILMMLCDLKLTISRQFLCRLRLDRVHSKALGAFFPASLHVDNGVVHNAVKVLIISHSIFKNNYREKLSYMKWGLHYMFDHIYIYVCMAVCILRHINTNI